jgi:hypothetical protein
MLSKQSPDRRWRAGVVVVCGGVGALLLLSPVSFRGEASDTIAFVVAGLLGMAAAHEAVPPVVRFAVLYPVVLLGPTVAACNTAMSGPRHSVPLGRGCRADLTLEGWVATSWITVEVTQALAWTPFEIERAQGRIDDVDGVGGVTPNGQWQGLNLADLPAHSSPTSPCRPSFEYEGRVLPVTWESGRRAR